VFLLAPTVFMSFSSVKILSFWFLTVCATVSVLLWERWLNLPRSRWRTLTIVALLLGAIRSSKVFRCNSQSCSSLSCWPVPASRVNEGGWFGQVFFWPWRRSSHKLPSFR